MYFHLYVVLCDRNLFIVLLDVLVVSFYYSLKAVLVAAQIARARLGLHLNAVPLGDHLCCQLRVSLH